jgi:signal transduction histidine kinase
MIALVGWVVAILSAAVAVAGWSRLGRRMELTARATHELRGPLTAARLGLELGARTGELSPARLRAIDVELARAALVLEELTGGGAPRMDEVDVEQVLADSVEAWRGMAAARRVPLELEWRGGDAYVRGDRLRLARATGNLIANAIEHGGGAIAVRGRVESGSVRIEVIDRGPGLPAPVAALARRPRAGRGHRGRGLAIAAGVADAHGGRLAAAPSDLGARLVLELPLSTGEPALAPVAG